MATPRAIRRDALPENTPYHDTGCCFNRQLPTFSCPLARCLAEMPLGRFSLRTLQRWLRVRSLHKKGLGIRAIAQRLDIHPRTVQRMLARPKPLWR